MGLPVIDVGGFLAEGHGQRPARRRGSRFLDRFPQIVGHGVPAGLMDAAYEAMARLHACRKRSSS